ncbi:MAG: DUF3185 family protein [Phycisphaerales bacterium]
MSGTLRELRAALGLALVGAGAWLFYVGTRAGGSFASGITRLFSGSPTKESVLLCAAGIAVAVLGLCVALTHFGRRRARR